MPYIKPEQRKKFEEVLEYLDRFIRIENCGELNYLLTKVILIYLNQKGERYQTYNDIIGVLECIKQELYRKKIAEYENLKENQNGTIFD